MGRSPVLLMFPPQFPPFQPHLAIPSLGSMLVRHEVDVHYVDANLAFYYYCLNAETVAEALYALEAQVKSSATDEISLGVLRCLASADEVLSRLASSMSLLSGRAPGGLDELLRAQLIVNRALQIVSRAHGFQMSLQDIRIESPKAQQGFSGLLRRFYESHISNAIKSVHPAAVGMSVATPQQRIGAQRLAQLVRKTVPSAEVVVGGSIPTYYALVSAARDYFTSWADKVFVGEADETLASYVCSRLGMPRNGLPGFVESSGIVSPESVPAMSDLPTPLFDGLPLADYLSPALVLPLLTSRGCAWRRCAFCSHSHTYGDSYRPRGMDRLAADLSIVRSKTNYVSFYDEFIPLPRLREVAETIAPWELSWSAYARFDTPWTTRVVRSLSESGCKLLSFGLESASNRVLQKMDKGITSEMVRDAMRSFEASGVWVHLFVIFGFPTERLSDLDQTLALIQEYSHAPVSFGLSRFGLNLHSKVYREPHRYGITRIFEPNSPFSYWEFEAPDGIPAQVLNQKAQMARSMLGDRWWQLLDFAQVFHLFPLTQFREVTYCT